MGLQLGRLQDVFLMFCFGVLSYHGFLHLFVYHDNHLKVNGITLVTPRHHFHAAEAGAQTGDGEMQSEADQEYMSSRYLLGQQRLALVEKYMREHREVEGDTDAPPGKASKASRRSTARRHQDKSEAVISPRSAHTDSSTPRDTELQMSETSSPVPPASAPVPPAPPPELSGRAEPPRDLSLRGSSGNTTRRVTPAAVQASSADSALPWQHQATGVPGGIGKPKEAAAESLFMLDTKHFHLHQAQFDEDGGRGGDVGNNGKARSAYLTYPVLRPDGSSQPETYTFRADDVPNMPARESQWSFSSCAIVSNSATMLKAKMGPEIDQHEAVWRINHAPVFSYEQYVGSRTTFDVMNRPHVQKYSKMRKGMFHTLRRHQNTSLVVFESTYSMVYYRLYSHLFLQFPFPGTVVISPDLSQAIYDKWKALATRWPELAKSCIGIAAAAANQEGHDRDKRCRFFKKDCEDALCKPSTGFFTLLIAAQVCNRITMYGFEAYKFSGTSRMSRYHYFDNEEGETDIHSFALLMRVFEYLASQYPIRISTPGHST
mmetsp:Transcript_37258/g.96689  ORF Transcript_37258/g.96689 Transcript_37258/m.96689 type:complete len:545 (-) Transcript_37258:810-2444(-)